MSDQVPQEILDQSNRFREASLGLFAKLTDKELYDMFFEDFTVEDLLRLQAVSQGFYVLLNDDRLWKDVFLFQIKGRTENVVYCGSWKASAISYLYAEKAKTSPFPFCNLHFPNFHSMEVYTRWLRRHMLVNEFGSDLGHIEHLDADQLSVQEFIERYEKPSIPVVIRGEAKGWGASTTWTKEKLVERFGETTFKITHQSHKRLPMKFKDYAAYMSQQVDEEPLYVFDEAFGEKCPDMLQDYSVPKYFPEDLFEVSGKERPHFRWIVIGPPRSGAPWHIDPAGTSAWNTLLSGKKRWLLYPPQFQPIGVHLEDISEKFYGSLPSLHWLLEIYPYLPPDNKPIECIQEPGETIFVPGGWWHMVLNMEESIAVTQNFCDSQNFKQVCEELSSVKREYESFKDSLIREKPQYQGLVDEFELLAGQMDHSFDNLDVWQPMVLNVCKKHLSADEFASLSPFEVKPPISGQSPVFIVNQKYVVKFYCTEFGGESAFVHETHLYEVLPEALKPVYPRLLGSGMYKELLVEMGDEEALSFVKSKCECQQKKSADSTQEAHAQCKEDEEKQSKKCTKCKDKMEFKWKWPFIVTSFVDGINLQEVQIVPQCMDYPYQPDQEADEDEEDEEEEEEPEVEYDILLESVLKNLMGIHSIPFAVDPKNPFVLDQSDPWSYWKSHLENSLAKKYRQNLYNWAGFPIHLINQVPEYFPKSVTDLIDYNLPPVYLHGDLTDENVLGTIYEKPKSKRSAKKPHSQKKDATPSTVQSRMDDLMERLANQKLVDHEPGIWKAEHFIDLGDSRFGDRFYELISLHLSIFAGDKGLFKQFLEKYKFPANDPRYPASLAGKSWADYYYQDPQAFIKRAMNYTIIHHCDAFTTVLRHHPEYRDASSIEHFAKLIWDLDYSEVEAQ